MIQSALEYHRATCYQRYDMQPHFLDWNNTPRTYKVYPELPSMALESTGSYPRKSLWDLMQAKAETGDRPVFHMSTLSDVLLLSYSLTAKSQMGGQTQYYRSVPSAGALYPTEMYVCSHHIQDLEPGVYYYDIHGFSLKRLRSGNRMPIQDADQLAFPCGDIAATILVSGIFFRSSWKYRTRAFRYVSLDTGHLVENIVATLNLYALPHTVHYNFDDDRLNYLIGVDGKREACFACIHIYAQSITPQQSVDRTVDDNMPLDAAILDASQVSPRESADDVITTVYRLGSEIGSQSAVKGVAGVTDQEISGSFSIKDPQKPDPAKPYAESVLKRRSTRSYRSDPYPRQHLMQLISLLCKPIPGRVKPESLEDANMAMGFLANNVSDFDSGFYLLDQAGKQYQLVMPGNLNTQMATVCLNQNWLQQAPLHFLFMSNLERLERRFNSRGYRYCMIDAGRMGQRLYLGATAMGDGCCGIGALYDQEARDLLGLNDGSYLLYLVAVGQPRGQH